MPNRLGIVFIFLGASGVFAQTNPGTIEQAPQIPAQSNQSQEDAAKAAKEAAAARPAEGREATYEQVLADPDNLELNYAWAKKQIEDGDLKGASATLERILLVSPELTRARMLFAVVLYRLDDIDEAERQLFAVRSQKTSPEVRAEAAQYLDLIAARRRKTHYSALLGFGWGYDDNRNTFPVNGVADFNGFPVQLTGSRQGDTEVTMQGTLRASQDLGYESGHQAFESFSYFQQEQTGLKTLNLKAFSPRAGLDLKYRWAEVTPTLIFDHVELAQTTFLRNYGAELKIDHRIDQKSDVYLDATLQTQVFSPVALDPLATDRDGNQWDFTAGYGVWITPTMKLTPSYDFGLKNAAQTFYAYRRNLFSLEHTWLLGRGLFLLTTASINFDKYNAPDPVLVSLNRSDTDYRARAVLGVPCALIHRSLSNFLTTFTYEYFQEASNVPNYSFTNNKILLMLNYSWGI